MIILKKYDKSPDLYYIDTDSFIIYIKANNFHEDIRHNEKKLDTSNYIFDRTSVPIGNNEKFIGLMMDRLVGKILRNFFKVFLNFYLFILFNCLFI